MAGHPFAVRFGLDATNNRLFNVADPQNDYDGVNLRTLVEKTGIIPVATAGHLPSPTSPVVESRPTNGEAHLIRANVDGQVLDRVAIWDSATDVRGSVSQVVIEVPAGEQANVLTEAAGGNSFPGMPLSGIGSGDALITISPQSDGTVLATIDNGGSNYAIGDTQTFTNVNSIGTLTARVSKLGGTASLGGWRLVNLKDWVKGLRTDADPSFGAVEGDLRTTTEADHEELKVYTGTTWKTLFTTDQIKAWIASLSLFEGTAKEVGGAAIGAVEFTALPDLTALTTANDLSKVSHYWTFVGSPNTAVTTATPIIGTDLDGAVLNPGDWIQVANRGTTAAPDLHWVTVGGDLLAKSRADRLYGLDGWVAGSYEQGSLVNYKGSLYKAQSAVAPTDLAPGTALNIDTYTIKVNGVPASAGAVYELTINGNTQNIAVPQTTVDAVATAVQTFVSGFAAWSTLLTATIDPSNSAQVLITEKNENAITNFGLTVTDGKSPQPPTFSTSTASSGSPWFEINLAAGITSVAADTDLPTTEKNGAVYLVLSSALAGGDPALYSFDLPTASWQALSKTGGLNLEFQQGTLIYPTVMDWDGINPVAKPDGQIQNDLLINTWDNQMESWDATANQWSVLHSSPSSRSGRLIGDGTTKLTTADLDWVKIPLNGGGTIRQFRMVTAESRFYLLLRSPGIVTTDNIQSYQTMHMAVETSIYSNVESPDYTLHPYVDGEMRIQIGWERDTKQKAKTPAFIEFDFFDVNHGGPTTVRSGYPDNAFAYSYRLNHERAVDSKFCLFNGMGRVVPKDGTRFTEFAIADLNEGLVQTFNY